MEKLKETLKIKQVDLIDEIKKNLNWSIHGIKYCRVEAPAVYVYNEKQIDKKTCEALGYPVYEAYYNGGTIVCGEGDILLIQFDRIENNWLGHFISYFVAWLKEKKLNAEQDSNDILVDGYKVCGTVITRYGDLDFTGAVISLNPNLDHIKAICKKPMVKVPKGLSEYGITTEEVEQMFLAFCEQEKNKSEVSKL
jgi:lipoate-protein ligase A